ncbi:bifunctional DNA-formamidopyrimidine glycosylase/DNA-(apurinic or apyrimidinic site) lyase [Fimbriiglobus ruber]|uniref:Formamidopyrimidine-DNA glycosylase n=1 Tax=Fimbriiglobus ruber TaxID=1908690 RepID=A0A225E3Z9_9BACT|nr:bifunctional DNA-formamidopyrimidine glycosylase/DNA-(apurinic or apyrimidinic site) lyase [Fimbriiglobus ruber]OWK43127.1 Formamidopyrimidine-DNA glycosylase [Fimbriiglobus ruber]
MPELPEVETVVRDLRPLLVGKRLRAVRTGKQSLRRPWQAAWTRPLTGATVAAVRRRGKWILIDLDGKASSPRLLIHLGMTGQLTVAAASVPQPDHLHLWFDLDGGDQQLRFRDPRRFGSADVFPDETALEAFLAERLGPEPFDLDAAAFRASLRHTTRPIKAVLLDQTVVAGVGNIYADEALHRVGLHPETRAQTIGSARADALREAVTTVLLHAIENRGSSIRDYVDGEGQKGGFQHEFRVYGRGKEPCLTCATTIEVVRVAGRSSHFCPRCQKPSRARKKVAEP